MSQNSDKLRFALIGCGHIGKRYAQILSENPETELVALCDVNPRENLASEFQNEIPFYSSLDNLLEKEEKLDVVVIATPNGFHASQTEMALNADLNVIVEKPMALNSADAEKVIELAKSKNRHILTVMQNRYSPPSIFMKDLVENRTLGKLNIATVNCYWNRDSRYYSGQTWHGDSKLDGGTLFTQFSHFVDTLFWLFGNVKNIDARLQDFNHKNLTDFEDSGLVNFNFENGGMGAIHYSTSCWDKNFESSLTVLGENGTVKIGGQYMENLEYCHIKDFPAPILRPTNPPNDYGKYAGSAANHQYLIQNVVDVLKHRKPMDVKPEEGLAVVSIIEEIYKSSKTL